MLSIIYCLEALKSRLNFEKNKKSSSISSVLEYITHCTGVMR